MKLPKFKILNKKHKLPSTPFIVSLILIGILTPLLWFSLRNPGHAAAWYNDNWTYRTKITFGNSGSADTNKKVKFDIDTTTLITAGKLQADCGDSRFTDINGTELEYYIDTTGGACNTSSTDYYVLIPNIISGTNVVYHYYGNSSIHNGSQASQFSQDTFSPTSGPSTGTEETTPGPMLYFKFDEATGTTAQDSSNNNNHGTLSGAIWKTTSECLSNNCLYFDGEDDYVDAGSSSSLDDLTEFTVSAWIFLNSFGENDTGIIATKDNPENGWGLYVNGSGGNQYSLEFQQAWSSDQLKLKSAGATLSTGQWYHVAVVHTGSQYYGDNHLYINGVRNVDIGSDGSGTILSDAARNLLIGNDDEQSRSFDGKIDEIKIYPYARSANQIKTDYIARGSTHGAAAAFGASDMNAKLMNGLVGWWKMDENTGTSSIDSSENNNTADLGTGGATPTWSDGKFNRSLSFDGTDDYLSITNSTSLQIGDEDFTISTWINPTNLTTHDQKIISKGLDNSSIEYGILVNVNGNANSVHFESTGSDCGYSHTFTLNSNLATGSWQHIIFVRKGSTFNVYLNGILSDSDASLTNICTSNDTLYLGENPNWSSYNPLNGKLDDTRIYNRALTPAEASALYSWAPGPVLYMPFDEKIGTTTVDDHSGNGFAGTMTGSMTQADWVSGKFGSALDFDGTDDYITIEDPGSSALAIPSSFSISLWVKPHTFPGGGGEYNTLLTKQGLGGGLTNNYFLELFENDEMDCGFGTGGGGSYVEHTTTDANISTNQWHFLSCVFDDTNNTLKMYLNGREVYSAAETNLPNASDANIFIGSSNGANPINSIVDEVRIYNYARTPAQIIEDMNGGHPVGGSPIGSQVAYWKFDEMSGTTTYDSSINTNNLTLSSASWTTNGKFNGAWNGTGSVWMSRGDDPDLDFGASVDFSLSGWFKSDSASNPGANQYLIHKQQGTLNQPGYRLFFNTSGRLVCDIDDDSTGYPEDAATTTRDYYDGTWHHVLCIRNIAAGTLDLYVDGKLAAQDTTLSATGSLANSITFYIGDDDGDATNSFAGDIDEVKIYRATLTPAQVLLEFNQGKTTILGSTSTNASGRADNSRAREYCIPGDTSACTPPIAEWKFDENTGSTAKDTSGNGFTGTLNNMTSQSWVNGKYGSALGFGGIASSNYVGIDQGDNSLLEFSTGETITISSWIYPTAFTTNGSEYATIITKGCTDNNCRLNYALYLPSGCTTTCPLSFVYLNDDGSIFHDYQTSSNVITLNTWQYVAVSYTFGTGSSIQMYRNGNIQNGSWVAGDGDDNPTDSFEAPVWIGGDNYSGGESVDEEFTGLLDQIRIYDYARTHAQIAWEYNRGAPIAWYKFDECQGTTTYNSVIDGNGQSAGNNGTITIGSSGNNDAAGTCSSGDSSEAWANGTSGKYNASLNFDGTDDRVVIADHATLRPENRSWSIGFWGKFPNSNQNSSIIAKSQNGGNFEEFNIYISNDIHMGVAGQKMGISLRESDTVERRVISDADVVDNTWHHYMWIADKENDTIRFYVDGKIHSYTGELDGAWPTVNNTDALVIGRHYAGTTTHPLTGNLDDVRIYNYALTSIQVKDIINNGAVNFR